MTVRYIIVDAVMFYRDWDITLYDEWHYVWICLRETVIIIKPKTILIIIFCNKSNKF